MMAKILLVMICPCQGKYGKPITAEVAGKVKKIICIQSRIRLMLRAVVSLPFLRGLHGFIK